MPKYKYNDLSDLKIRGAVPREKPYRLVDGNGLFLEVRPKGSKNWRLKYRLDGKENVYAIGAYPEIPLAEARALRDKAKELVKQGINPSHHRQKIVRANLSDTANTFQALAEEWIAKNKANWSDYYLYQIERGFEVNVYPRIGAMPINAIDSGHILDVLEAIDARGAKVLAGLIRQWLSAVFQQAIITRVISNDPALPLRGYVKRDKVKHHRPLSKKDITGFLETLDKSGCNIKTKVALRLLMLTFVRPGELRGASWEEFDLEAKEWRIPAERMKIREPHIVPLSEQAVEQLKELLPLGSTGYLFPNIRKPNTVMSNTTLNRALERMGFNGKGTIGFSAHGFRATASTLLHERGYRSDLIEKQLAHSDRNKVRASYNQAQYLDERRKMMQEWADFIDELR